MVRLRPDGGRLSASPQALFADATRRHAANRLDEAVALCRELLTQEPRHAAALHMMGVIARQKGNGALALDLIRAALTADPKLAAAWHDQALLFYEQKRLDEAMTAICTAVEVAPQLAAAWALMALIAMTRNDAPFFVEACHRRATELAPNHAPFLGNYAAFLLGRGQLEDAYLMARRARDADPFWLPIVLGNALKAMGYPDLAADCYVRAHALHPDWPEAKTMEASARLMTGAWAMAWPLWLQRPNLDPTLSALPLWNGKDHVRLIVYEDQGLGDAIHFARYLPWLRDRADIAALRLRAPLVPLFAEAFPDLPILDEAAPLLADVSARCRLSDLPAFAASAPETVPAAPYLNASPARRAVWQERLRSLPAPRIGLVWAGNPNFRNDAARSLTEDALSPLLASGEGHFVSLQRDRIAPSGVFDAAPFLSDFAETAAAIAELDLVISVDTATAHLAGALGKPVWLLLPFDNDWRWLIGREDSPWYPTARLFRQTRPNDWRAPLAAVAGDLRTLIAGDVSVLTASKSETGCLRRNPNAVTLPV